MGGMVRGAHDSEEPQGFTLGKDQPPLAGLRQFWADPRISCCALHPGLRSVAPLGLLRNSFRTGRGNIIAAICDARHSLRRFDSSLWPFRFKNLSVAKDLTSLSKQRNQSRRDGTSKSPVRKCRVSSEIDRVPVGTAQDYIRPISLFASSTPTQPTLLHG